MHTNFIELYRLYRQRLPYLIEDYFGINMNYYTSIQIPNNLLVMQFDNHIYRLNQSGGWSRTARPRR